MAEYPQVYPASQSASSRYRGTWTRTRCPISSSAWTPGVDAADHGLIVDLSRVTFLAVCAIEALIEAHYRAGCAGIDVVLVVGPRCVKRAVAATDADMRFHCFASPQRAFEVCESRYRWSSLW